MAIAVRLIFLWPCFFVFYFFGTLFKFDRLRHARHAHVKRGGEIPLPAEELSRKPISRQWIEHLLNIIRKDRARVSAQRKIGVDVFVSSLKR